MKYTTKRPATLIDTILEMYQGISRQKAKQIISRSEIKVNDQRIEKHALVKVDAGVQIEIFKDASDSNIKKPTKNKPVVIYFEDKYFIIALKPAGLLSCGDRSIEKTNTATFHKLLENFVEHRDEQRHRLWVVHRLDKEVEGLIIFAKSEAIQEKMKENWQDVTKKYLALTQARPAADEGVIESWLKEGYQQKVYSYNKEIEGSKHAITKYKYVRQEREFHVLELTLHTGRKNQIRSQLASIDCAIVGDRKYGADDSIIRQIRLAAYRLEFVHPFTNDAISLEYTPIARFFCPSKTYDENYKIVKKIKRNKS
ncbi:MAG: RluA family pseudouridine synthase [Bacteroidales bacterium]|nr:RluA family pseudouridine synthase [Bacteroidales bacterium]